MGLNPASRHADNSGVSRTSALVAAAVRLPRGPSPAMQVLWALDGTDATAAELGALVSQDHDFEARLLQLANCPYYGLTSRIATPAQAIMVIGFVAVRARAVGAATELFGGRRDEVPEGFWSHAAATAAASSIVAERSGDSVADAFSAGLLHDVGVALLHRHLGPDYLALQKAACDEGRPIVALERERLDTTHAEIATEVLTACKLPAALVDAVAHHHDLDVDDHLARTVRAGEAIAVRLLPTAAHHDTASPDEALAAAGIPPGHLDAILSRMRSELDELACLLSW